MQQRQHLHSTLLSQIVPILLMLSAVVLLSASCSTPEHGYGVVLRDGKSFSLKPGTIVDVHDDHKVDNTLTISNSANDVRVEVHKGYIQRFSTLEAAHTFKQRYSAYLDLFATARVNGLIVRKQPNQESTLVYKLRKGERVKVIIPKTDTSRVEGNRGKWYLVCTEDGYNGYVFSSYLTFHEKGTDRDESRRKKRRKQLLNRLFETVWRPAYMQKAIRKDRIDLKQLDPEIGLFAKRESRTLRLRTKEVTHTFPLEKVRYAGDNILRIGNTQLTLDFLSEGELMAEYEYRGELVRDRFVKLEVALEKRIKKEKQRRRSLYQTFFEKDGTRFLSEHYGELVFTEEGTIHWRMRRNVPSSILPPDAAETGRVLFNLSLPPSLKQSYDGAFTFRFPVGERKSRVHFLYKWHAGGLQLTHVPREGIKKKKIKSERELSLVLFFRGTHTD